MVTLKLNHVSGIKSLQEFNEMAIETFHYQSKNNVIYSRYLKSLGIIPDKINEISQIPFLPIDFFKNHEIKTGNWEPKEVFLSSGTSGSHRSKHFIRDSVHYLNLATDLFEQQYGSLKSYQIIALLPSYLENGNSSLIKMVNHFIKQTGNKGSGFYAVEDKPALKDTLMGIMSSTNLKTLILGVSYALLDLAEFGLDLKGATVMETGGMKGRGEELTRDELHQKISTGLNIEQVHSEYGMTELLSQFYSKKGGIFNQSPSARVYIREVDDPFTFMPEGRVGGVNIIDLGNLDTCAFIETRDLGRLISSDRFQILGRFDNSDIRGCNLLYTR